MPHPMTAATCRTCALSLAIPNYPTSETDVPLHVEAGSPHYANQVCPVEITFSGSSPLRVLALGSLLDLVGQDPPPLYFWLPPIRFVVEHYITPRLPYVSS